MRCSEPKFVVHIVLLLASILFMEVSNFFVWKFGFSDSAAFAAADIFAVPAATDSQESKIVHKLASGIFYTSAITALFV